MLFRPAPRDRDAAESMFRLKRWFGSGAAGIIGGAEQHVRQDRAL
jgi:hypothetical protein